MKDFFRSMLSEFVAFHQLRRVHAQGDDSHLTNVDKFFYSALWLSIYTIVVLINSLLMIKGSFLSIAISIAIMVVTTVTAYQFGYKRVPLYSKEFKTDVTSYSVFTWVHDWVLTVVIGAEMFLGYVLLTSFAPSFALKLNDVTKDVNVNPQVVMTVVTLFVLVQPWIDGVIRGYLTSVGQSLLEKTRFRMWYWLIPVLFMSVLHIGTSVHWSLIVFSVYQAVLYQLIQTKFDYITSIRVNIVFNILLLGSF